jgi:transposase
MQILVSRVCGIDVHKDMRAVCVLVYREGKEPEARYKEFATHQKALTALGNWLSAQKVTQVVMESTGVLEAGLVRAGEGFSVAVGESVSGEGAARQEDG